MKAFMDENFLLESKAAEELYHGYASDMPIIDYHCHLSPQDIADDRRFESMTKMWLDCDHYKWRAMRINGVDERYCSGNATDYEKFEKWAETVPYTLRNPLYHWTHMELKRPFGIHGLLNRNSAKEIYGVCNELLQEDGFSARGIMRGFGVEVICTTDDPVDTLADHQRIRNEGFEIKVLPTWRPDRALMVDDPVAFQKYVGRLEEASGLDISTYSDFLEALRLRHDFFHGQGCVLSDHGLETLDVVNYTEKDVEQIFLRIRQGMFLKPDEKAIFRTSTLYELALMDYEKGWVQQFHLGALRNISGRMFKSLGADTGFDAIGDFEIGRPLVNFFDKLDCVDKLGKSIVYNLNPCHNEMVATILGGFNNGGIPGKLQYGSGWWFLDQKDGMTRQINALSNMGLLSRFIGMLTDSRSFLSYSRHEYFRRILCNMLGADMENGEIPGDMDMVGAMVRDICYHNAKRYFGF